MRLANLRFHGHDEMTMKKARQIPAGRFKAECLALLDRVAETGESLVVTKRGRPVARVLPVEAAAPQSLLGSVRIVGDLLEPTGVAWEADS
jgi:prevent-host-death family protein